VEQHNDLQRQLLAVQVEARRAQAEAQEVDRKRAAGEKSVKENQAQLQSALEKSTETEKHLNEALSRLQAAQAQNASLEKSLAEETKRAETALTPVRPARERTRQPGMELVRLLEPEGEYTLPPLLKGATVRLMGQIKTLKVASLNGGSALEILQLRAQEILFLGAINDGSRVTLQVPQARLVIPEISGKSRVDIRNLAGRVSIERINGESLVSITAKEVDLPGSVTGMSSISATITREGRLHFKELQGNSKLSWKKQYFNDPRPQISEGILSQGAQFNEIK
jgi:hypothetical protein